MLELRFPNPAKSSADDIFGMEQTHKLTEDMESLRQTMVDYLDSLNYSNGHSFDDVIQTRHAIAYLAAALPSLAYIDPHKTREMIYNLGLVVMNIQSEFLKMRVSPYNSDNMIVVEQGLAAALYRMVSGDGLCDDILRRCAETIFSEMQQNSVKQHIFAIDTTRGRFDALPNLMSMMIFELHDKFFGSRYSVENEKIMNFILENLRDKETGLFYESYQTGFIGYANEAVNPASAWRTNVLRPSVNGLVLTFMNYFRHEQCAEAWEKYKEIFMDSLMELKTEDLADSVGASFYTQLGPGSEDLLAAILASKEMGDTEAFDKLQSHLYAIGAPNLWEGHFFLSELGEMEHMISLFLLFAQGHVGWKKLMEHSWEKYYKWDYVEVR